MTPVGSAFKQTILWLTLLVWFAFSWMAIIHQAVANAPAEESKLSSREMYSDKLRTRAGKTRPRRSHSCAVLASWMTILLSDAVQLYFSVNMAGYWPFLFYVLMDRDVQNQGP